MGSIQEVQLNEIRHQFPGDWEVSEFHIDFWNGKTSDCCVIIPVINEGERIRHFVHRLKKNRIDSIADIIIVDGGSTDGSLEPQYLRSYGVRGLITKTGAGKLSAQLRVAYAFALAANYEYLITIDGNNKDDPSSIPIFLEKLHEGYDFVQASRFVAGGIGINTPPLRYLAIRLLHAPISSLAAGFWWTDTTQGFRGYSRNMLISPSIKPFRNIFSSYELLAYLTIAAPKNGFRCVEVASTRVYPHDEVPTKISAFRGNLLVFKILLKAFNGLYDPNRSASTP